MEASSLWRRSTPSWRPLSTSHPILCASICELAASAHVQALGLGTGCGGNGYEILLC
jgi:hypothetical protein